jgi:hypothetical protein
VDKHVGRTVLGGDEAESLLRVEPLHSSLWHFLMFPLLLGCGAPPFGAPGPVPTARPCRVAGTSPDLHPRRNRGRNVDPAKVLHEHRSCDRKQSTMFNASATAYGDQFSYHEVNNSSVKPKSLAAGCPSVEVFGICLTSGRLDMW